MTSACPLSSSRNRQFLRIPALSVLAGFFLVLLAGGCKYQKPANLTSPFLPYQQVWGVVPLTNESGVSIVDRLAVTDSLMLEVASIQGIDVRPLNRTLEAMLALEIGLEGIPTDEEYQILLQALDVDALVVGTVIAFDPYQPLRFGASLELILPRERGRVAFDPRSLTMAVGSQGASAPLAPPAPLIQASGIFDAENHGVLLALKQYAGGRTTHELARSDVGLYLLDMDDYSEFVFHELLKRLLGEAAFSSPGGTAVAAAGS